MNEQKRKAKQIIRFVRDTLSWVSNCVETFPDKEKYFGQQGQAEEFFEDIGNDKKDGGQTNY